MNDTPRDTPPAPEEPSAELRPQAPRNPTSTGNAGDAGGRRLKIIAREPLETAIDVAVSRALRAHFKRLPQAQSSAIRDTARRELLELLRQNGKRVRGISKSQFMVELERSRNKLLADRDRARQELDELRQRSEMLSSLREDEERALESQAPGIRAAGERELEAGMGELLRLFQEGEIDAAEFQRRVVALSSKVVQHEWQSAIDERSGDYEEELSRMRRRINKLNVSLKDSEHALSELARLKEVDGGLASIYRTVQGLGESEENREAKRAMLVEIFQANMELQGKAATA